MTDVQIVNPAGNIERATAIRGFIIARQRELEADAERLLAEVADKDKCSLKMASAKLKEFKGTLEDLRDHGKRLVRAVCEETQAAVILRQIDERFLNFSTKIGEDSSYSKLSAKVKDIADVIEARKAAELPAAPTRLCPVILVATDEAVRKLCADISAGKRAGITDYVFAPDEATEKKAVKVIAAGRTI